MEDGGALDGKFDGAEEKSIQDLSDAGKYSYASLCAIMMSTLCESENDRKWCEKRLEELVEHLALPKQVIKTLLEQAASCVDCCDEIHVDFNSGPLVATLKNEQSLSSSFVLILEDLLTFSLESGGYDSRLRVLVLMMAEHLSVPMWHIKRYENALVEKLRNSTQVKQQANIETQRIKDVTRRRKKALLIALGAIGGGAVIGLTGGLAAPLVAAGVGAVVGGSSAAVLSTTAGLAIITSLFGAAGAGLTGYRLNRRVGDIEEFQFDTLSGGNQLHITIAISGWFTEETKGVGCAFKTPWRSLNNSEEQYFLRWESRYLAELGCAISSLLTSSSVGLVTQEALKYTILNGIMAAISWPLILLQLGYVIDNPWNVCARRAAEVGRHLAEVLFYRQQGKRPVTLVGFSMGARVIFFCLQRLAKLGGQGIIEDVVILGAPVSGDPADWYCLNQVVAGRVVNGYCRSDWFLKFAYRTASVQVAIAGLQAINWKNRRMVNVDLSTVINRHYDYADPDKMEAILEIIGMNTKSQHSTPRTNKNQPFANTCSHSSPETSSTRDDALSIVTEIIEERIDIAMEVCSIVHHTNDIQDKGQVQLVFS